MDLSIIIVNWNTKGLLKDCLKSIFENPLKGESEVLVVDNASSDGSPEMVRHEFPQVILIRNEKNVGFAKANNIGIGNSRGRYVLLLNSDTLVLPHSLDQMVQYMESHAHTGIIGPKLIDRNGEIIQMSWGWGVSLLGEALQKCFAPSRVQRNALIRKLVICLQSRTRKVPIVAGASMLIRKATLDRIGLLDKDLVLYLEEPDICRRAWHSNWSVVFLPEARVVHLLGKSADQKWGKAGLIYRQSQLHFYEIHHSRLQLLLLKAYLYVKFYIILQLNRSRSPASREKADFCRQVFSILKEEIVFKLD